MNFEFYSQTDTGRVRTNNEDSVALDESCAVAVLADGMGGYAAGEVASGMACDFNVGRASAVACAESLKRTASRLATWSPSQVAKAAISTEYFGQASSATTCARTVVVPISPARTAIVAQINALFIACPSIAC